MFPNNTSPHNVFPVSIQGPNDGRKDGYYPNRRNYSTRRGRGNHSTRGGRGNHNNGRRGTNNSELKNPEVQSRNSKSNNQLSSNDSNDIITKSIGVVVGAAIHFLWRKFTNISQP